MNTRQGFQRAAGHTNNGEKPLHIGESWRLERENEQNINLQKTAPDSESWILCIELCTFYTLEFHIENVLFDFINHKKAESFLFVPVAASLHTLEPHSNS